ncbi:Relaxase/Mobilisation nuclease domain-containing protein [Paraburkholderia phenazinium]|uniref:Relaxase/Mobilisation nuclease domain-containing protein n=2 Tax=Paraburkholderia phenazinium TaxID=60549 RepID=A0A1N6KYI9_9BURK|nr:Relaxase/Mobilisation nuclease domain-containing protein [Paraburkholderia phenazinium]
MNIKKIKNPDRRASKAKRITELIRYCLNPDDGEGAEKCVYSGALGFLTDGRAAWTAEMIALSEEAVRSKDTVSHFVMSWPESETPSKKQIDEAMAIFLRAMGFAGHQAIYAAHTDTDNFHVHVVVNRVHPETHKMVAVNKGFDLEAIHMAIARIDSVQGWKRSPNARYYVDDSGTVERVGGRRSAIRREPGYKKQDQENRTGEKSVERMAIERAAPIILAAKSWQELHERLAAEGFRYERKGSGAVVFLGDIPVKASNVHRSATLSKMEKRLGAFESAGERIEVRPRVAEPLMPGFEMWAEYNTSRKQQASARKSSLFELRRRHAREKEALALRQRRYREVLLRPPGRNWRGHGVALNALRSVLKDEQDLERAALAAFHKDERVRLAERFPPAPSFEEFLRARGREDLAERWRHRNGYEIDDTEAPPADTGRSNPGTNHLGGSHTPAKQASKYTFKVVPQRTLTGSTMFRIPVTVVKRMRPHDGLDRAGRHFDLFDLTGNLVARVSGDRDQVVVDATDVVLAAKLALHHAAHTGWTECWIDGDIDFRRTVAAMADARMPPVAIFDRAGLPLNQTAVGRALSFGDMTEVGVLQAGGVDDWENIEDQEYIGDVDRPRG